MESVSQCESAAPPISRVAPPARRERVGWCGRLRVQDSVRRRSRMTILLLRKSGAGGQDKIDSATGNSFLSLGRRVSEVAGRQSSPGRWNLAEDFEEELR